MVLRAQSERGADLRRLLAEEAGPDAELALALERGGLGVDATDQHQVAVEAAQVLVGEVLDVLVVLGVVDALPLGGQQLDHLGSAVTDLRDRGGVLVGRNQGWEPAGGEFGGDVD